MDEALVRAAQGGDQEAFAILANASAPRLHGIACLVLRDADQAKDAVQEAIIRAWIECPRLRDPARWEAWLYRLVVNACADESRRRRRWSAQVTRVEVEPFEPDASSVLADRDQLDRGFQRLKTEHRVAIVLRYYAGLTVPQVAEVLGIPLGTAKSRIHFATEAMRSALATEAPAFAAVTEGTTT